MRKSYKVLFRKFDIDMSEQTNMAARYEHEIPEGYEARIDGNKVVIEKKENDDERIRKELIGHLKECRNNTRSEVMIGAYANWIAYLEKQKEQPKELLEPDSKVEKVIEDILHQYAKAYQWIDGYDIDTLIVNLRRAFNQKEQPKKELVYRMNGLMQEYVEEVEDKAEKEHRLKCYRLFWRALKDADFFKQKEQKPILPKPHKGDDDNPYDMPVSMAQEYAIKRGFGIPFNDGEVFVDERYMTQTIGNILRWDDEHPKEQKPVKLNDDTEVGLDRALQIVKAAKGNLCGYQSDDGIYECDHAIQTLERILKNGIEQKPVNSFELSKDGFTPNDVFRFNLASCLYNYGKEVAAKCLYTHILDDNLNHYVTNSDVDRVVEKNVELLRKDAAHQQPAEWSEEDREMIQSIITNGCIDDKQEHWLRLLPERILQPKQEWSEEDEKWFKEIELMALSFSNSADYRSKFFNWLDNRLKSLRPQLKQEWSEHDKKMLSAAIMYVEMAMDNPGVVRDALLLDWLKCLPASIHPQPHWKPSGQEKGALRTAISILTEERNFPKAAEHLQAILDSFEGKESRKDWKPSEEQMYILNWVANILLNHDGIVEEEAAKKLQSLYLDLKSL